MISVFRTLVGEAQRRYCTGFLAFIELANSVPCREEISFEELYREDQSCNKGSCVADHCPKFHCGETDADDVSEWMKITDEKLMTRLGQSQFRQMPGLELT